MITLGKYSLDLKGLSTEETQLAIDLYVNSLGELIKENSRLNKITDELLNELNYLRKWRDWYQERYDSD